MNTNFPSSIYAGSNLEVTDSFQDYPATTYAVNYLLRNSAGKIDITSTNVDGNHVISLNSTQTASYVAGDYRLFIQAKNGNDEYIILTKDIKVYPNIESLNSYDSRSFAEKNLEALESAMLNYGQTTNSVEITTSAGSRKVTYNSVAELQKVYNYWKSVVMNERRDRMLRVGRVSSNLLKARFTSWG